MLSFEEFKKRKKENSSAASESQQKQSNSKNNVMTFEEWKAQGEPKKKNTERSVAPSTPRQSNAQIVANARKYLQSHQEENQSKWDSWQKEYEQLLAAAENERLVQQDYIDKSKYDIAAGQKEIEALEEQLKQLSQSKTMSSSVNGMPYAVGQQAVYSEEYAPAANNVNGMPYAAYQQAMYAPVDNQEAELSAEIQRRKQYLNQAKQIQRKIAFESAAGNKDFEQQSAYVASEDDLYNWINDEQFRNEYEGKHNEIYSQATGMRNDGTKKSKFAINNYGQLTEDEVKLYNYYYATEGAEKAQEYLDTIQEDLNMRSGKQIADKYKGKTGAEIFFGVATGLDQFGSGMRGAISGITGKEDYIPQSQLQYAGQVVREDLADNGAKMPEWMGGGSLAQGAYDLVSTTANMAPSILASVVLSPAAGSALMGTSAAGNAYQTALNAGYDKNAARTYGVAIGVAETAMQSLLGGISSLGGVSPAVTKAVEGIDNGMLRFFAKYGASMASEGLEEGLQEVLDPILQNAILGADENVDWANVVYSALLGAASAGVLEIGGNISEVRQESAVKAEYGSKTDELIAEGLSYDAGTEANDLAQRYKTRTESGKSLTGAQIKRQLEANDVQRVETAAKERLVELGETDDPAEIAKLATKRAMGETLKPAEKSRLARSKFGAQVAKELVPDKAANGKMVEAMTRPGKYKPLDTRVEADVSQRVSESSKNELVDSGKEFDLKQVDAKTGSDGKLIWTVDGQETDTDNIKFKDEDTAHIFQAVEQIENISATAAPVLVRSVDASKNIIKQLNGLDEAYTYGFYNYSIEDLKAGEFVAGLTETQMMDAYRLGEAARARVTEKIDTSKVNLRTAEQKAEQVKKRMITDDTEVYFADGSEVVKFDQHNHQYDEKRMAGVNAAKFLSKMGIGGKFYFYESYMKDGVRVYKDANGKEVPAPNGMFKAVDGSVYIDMNAGNTGEGITLFTMGHELTHFVRAYSEKQFKRLSDLVKEAYDKTELSMHQRVIAKQETLSKIRNEHVSYDEAYEEVVADAMSTMLTDGNLYEKLAELRSTDKSLFETIKKFFDELISKFVKVYESLTPDQQDAQDIRELKDMFDSIQTAFAEALVEASDNFQTSETVLAQAGISVDSKTDAGSIYSVRDVLSEADRNKVAKALAERFSVTEMEAKEWLRAETSLASLILNPKYSMYLDYEGDPNEVAIKQNSDYPQGTVDFSNICKKRREFTQVMNRILRNFPNHVFAATDLAKIRTIMGEEGMTLPCGICYVEDRRQLDTIVAQDFINGLKLYREGSKTRPDGKPFNANQLKGLQLTDGDTYVPTIYELVSLEGRNSLKAKNPNMEAAWVRYNNARGMQAVRLLTNEAEYQRQILKYNKKTVQSKNDHGGLRIYSFSDAEMFHLIDIIQVITDSATVGLSLQGYTKVNEYAKAVKDTGEKLNRSLIPKGDLGYHMENGKVILDYDTVEGIDIHHKDFFDNKDNPNVGNITIGINDVQIRAAMLSDFVDQIIPFHTGQSEEVLGEKGIAAWDNYKDSQTEKDLATGRTSSHQVNIYTEVFQTAEAEGKPIQNKRQFVEKFLQVCKENGLQPRFSQFLNTDANGDYIYTEGYHKFLVDFKTFAQTEVGEYLPQMPVKPIFDDAYITGLLEAYVDEQRAKDAEVAKQMPKVIERITNEMVKPGEKHSDRTELSPSEYNRLTSKKPINVTSQEMAMIRTQRKSKYSSLEENDIPIIDFFRIGDYRSINNGFIYYIRNSGSDSFSVVMKKKIVSDTRRITREVIEDENRRNNATTDPGAGQERGKRGPDRSSSERTGNGRELSENDQSAVLSGQSQRDLHSGQGNADSRTVKRSDRDYMAAVKSGDMETAQKMVDEAARAAGYTSPRLFHGTQQFGFTVPDTSKSDDGLSFFATDSVEVARTYSGAENHRQISDKAGDIDSLRDAYNDHVYDFVSLVNSTAGIYNFMDYDDKKLSSFRIKLDVGAFDYETVSDALADYVDGIVHNLYEEALSYDKDLMAEEFFDSEEIKKIYEVSGALDDTLKAIANFDDGTAGNYQLYANTEGLFEIDADGNNWNRIPFQSTSGEYLVTTRRLAQYAKAEGYKGVKITNIFDDGGRSVNYQMEPATVYIFFDPQKQVKSADPVTYDESGNVIPLSERFKQEQKDIRYSVRDFLADGQLKGNYTVSEISEMFDAWNSNPELSELAAKVFSKLQEIMDGQKSAYWATPYPIRFKTEAHLQKAYYVPPHGIFEPSRTDGNYGITYNLDYFRKTSDQDKARILLHEAIHACTVSAIKSVEMRIPKRIDPMNVTPDESWSDVQKAGLELIQVFDQVRVANDRNEYGQKNVYEMVAEMSNPDFRAMLKKERLWDRIVNAIKRIFGIEQRTAYDAVSNALDTILEQDARYSERTPDSISNRSLLSNAFETISRSSVEYGMIQDYKRNIDRLNKLENDLSDVNAEIRQLRFGKDVERDPDRLRELEDKAESLAKEINKYDKRLINMEASEPLRKVLDRERKKVRQRTIEHTKQIQHNRKLRKEQTELRKRIRRTIMDLDKILNKGDKKRNVKDGLRTFVEQAIKATDVLFMDDVKPYDMLRAGFTATLTESEKAQVEEARKMLDELDEIYGQSNEQNPAKDPAFVAAEARLDSKIAEMNDIFERENMAREETTVSGVISKIMIEYKKLEKSPQIEVRNAYSDAVYEHMGQLAEVIGNTRIKDMTADQLQNLYQMYSWVKATVTMANKFFADNIKQSVKDMAFQSVTEFKRAEAQRKKDKRTEAVYAVLDKIGWSNEKVMYALRRMDNSVITTLMQNIINGEDVTMRDVQEAIEFRKGVEKKYNYKKWDFDKTYTFEDKHGEEFEMNLHQMLSFYAYSRREAARDHIARGGIVVRANTVLKKDSTDAHAISEEGIAQIESALTEEQRAYVREMQSYLSDVMGAKGNEVSLKLYGIKMFNEETYFPIRSSSAYLSKAGEANLKAEMGITNMASAGFTKSIVPHAATPIELGGFLDVWANHVNEMSRYHGFVLPMEDFRRVFNFSSYATDESSTAVRASMENAFGKQAVKYFDDLYRDLNSGASTDRSAEKTVRKLFSRFKKNAVMYSLSVVVQQPTAIVRAGAMIDRKHFGIFGSTGRIATGMVRLFSKNHTKLWNEMLEYAPGVTTIKDIGGFDTATGGSILSALKEETYENASEHWNEFTKHPLKWTSYIADNNTLSKIPAYADQIAWVEIWNAVKRETLAANRNMTPNSKEHLDLVGKRFSEVIRMTQVYDSVFAKSPLMRSQNLAVQMLTSFMSEPNTTINMVEDGMREMARGHKRTGLRILWTVAASITFNNLIKSVVYAMRDDDEDQNLKEKYIESVVSGILNDFNPLNYIIFARDVWSIAQGYDVERADMTLISDLADNLTRVTKLSQKDTSEMDDDQLAAHEKAQRSAYMALVYSIGALTGFPIKNIIRDVKAFNNTFLGNKVGESTKLSLAYTVEQAWNEALPTMLRPETTPKTDVLYETIMVGDAVYLNRLKNGYKDEKAYTTAVRKALRENDPRIAEAAQALYANNAAEYKRLYQQIRTENKFSADDILSAIDSEAAALKKDVEGTSESAPYSASDFVKATIVGDAATAKSMKNEYISFKVASGVSKADAEKKFQQSVQDSVNEAFAGNMLTRSTAKKMLIDHAGKSADEAEDRITYWEFKKKYPQYNLSDDAVWDYYDIAEPLGIGLRDYVNFVEGKKTIETKRDENGAIIESSRDQTVALIHSLKLTSDQKDALYILEGYSKNKLEDTPWH